MLRPGNVGLWSYDYGNAWVSSITLRSCTTRVASGIYGVLHTAGGVNNPKTGVTAGGCRPNPPGDRIRFWAYLVSYCTDHYRVHMAVLAISHLRHNTSSPLMYPVSYCSRYCLASENVEISSLLLFCSSIYQSSFIVCSSHGEWNGHGVSCTGTVLFCCQF